MKLDHCPNCNTKLGGLKGNAPFVCKSCNSAFCKSCTEGLAPVRKCLKCGGKAKLKRVLKI